MSDIVAEIARWKAERRAVILAHNYQVAEVQEIADFVGDSLELSMQAARLTEPEVIVFCGVHFMAETAKLLAPDKTVLLPDPTAGCPMADMVTPEALRALKAQHPGVPVVCYVNTSVAVKAECDIACTSANAVQIVAGLGVPEVIFVPDRNLGAWVQRHTDTRLILWAGYCPTHQRIMPETIAAAKAAHPEAEVMIHPECPEALIALADHVASTGGMVRLAKEGAASSYIVVTEEGMLHRLRRDNPAKTFYGLTPQARCPNMKKTSLEKVLWALQDLQHPVTVPDAVAGPARAVITRMLAAS
jgi:quinolinate synthase